MLKINDKIGEYTLIEKVGAGGFGDVWKAEKRTQMDVNYFALKFFRPKDDAVDLEKIQKELDVWKKLRGLPHIISVIELDKFDDYVYVVCDFADGGSLESWLKNNGGKIKIGSFVLLLKFKSGRKYRQLREIRADIATAFRLPNFRRVR